MDLWSWPTELWGWKQKLGVSQKVWTGRSDSLWALGSLFQHVRVGDMQAAQGVPWSKVCAGDASSLPQSAVAVPNLNRGVSLHKLHSLATCQVHWTGYHTMAQWEKATGILCASGQATQGGVCLSSNICSKRGFPLYIYSIFSPLHNVFSLVTIFYHTPALHCFKHI